MKLPQLILILLLSVIIIACSATEAKKHAPSQHIITVAKTKQTSTLYFDGVISPLNISVVASPIDGTVENMFFNYGDEVKKGQLLLTLKSATLGKSYQQAISTYLTAKEKYNTSKSNIAGAKDLYDSGITSRQTYHAALSDLNDSYLSFLQAELAVVELLRSAGINEHDIYLLKINNEAAVKKALQTPLKSISIFASMNGIALIPLKSDTSSDSNSQAIHIGSILKQGQVITSIGEMSSIKISINVGETRVNQIKVGDPAIITSAAFPGITLTGEVESVSSQANTNDNSGGLPTFPVVVAVKNVTAAQQQVIHVGMSAKVQINSSSSLTIIIPLTAVISQGNQTFVKLVTPISNNVVQHAVQVGPTTIDGVTIISGLKAGDQIVISH